MPHVKLHADHPMVLPLLQNVAIRAPGAQKVLNIMWMLESLVVQTFLQSQFFERSVEEGNTLEKGICYVTSMHIF